MGPIKRGWPRQHNSAGARAPGVKRQAAASTVVYQRTAFPDFEPGHNDKVAKFLMIPGSQPDHESAAPWNQQVTAIFEGARCTKDGCKPCDAYIPQSTGRHRLTYRPWSQTEENSPSGILGGDDGNGGIIRNPIRAIALPDPIPLTPGGPPPARVERYVQPGVDRRKHGRMLEQPCDPIVPMKVGNRGAPARGGHGTHWREGGSKRTNP